MNHIEALTATVSAAEARAEIEWHGESWTEFICEFGTWDEYEGSDVLEFLGY